MNYLKCFHQNCPNKILIDLPRKLYTIHPNLQFTHIDTIITNYNFEHEHSHSIWAPINYKKHALFCPFCSKNCLTNYLTNYNNPNSDIFVITLNHR